MSVGTRARWQFRIAMYMARFHHFRANRESPRPKRGAGQSPPAPAVTSDQPSQVICWFTQKGYCPLATKGKGKQYTLSSNRLFHVGSQFGHQNIFRIKVRCTACSKSEKLLLHIFGFRKFRHRFPLPARTCLKRGTGKKQVFYSVPEVQSFGATTASADANSVRDLYQHRNISHKQGPNRESKFAQKKSLGNPPKIEKTAPKLTIFFRFFATNSKNIGIQFFLISLHESRCNCGNVKPDPKVFL